MPFKISYFTEFLSIINMIPAMYQIYCNILMNKDEHDAQF